MDSAKGYENIICYLYGVSFGQMGVKYADKRYTDEYSVVTIVP